MYRRILVPVDGSDASLRGLNEALKLAKQQNSEIRIVYVVSDLVTDYSVANAYTGTLLDALRCAGRDVLQSAEAACRAQGLNPDLKQLETIGRPAAVAIVEQAREWPADLIVMGTHGRRGIRHLTLGSDAEQVVRTSSVPVLLVRADNTIAK